MDTIGVDQYLTNSALYRYTFLVITKKVYKDAGSCDDVQRFKATIEPAMLSNPVMLTKNSTKEVSTSGITNKSSEKKPLCQISNLFYVKLIIFVCLIGTYKTKIEFF